MRGVGEELLKLLCESDYPQSTQNIARQISWATDGRSVRPGLSRLEHAELVRREKKIYWRPTERGREVNEILDRITVARGGTFAGRRESGIDYSESHALR